jgi:hypothetical protein
MDEKQKEWNRQYTSNINGTESLRLGCAIMVWVLIGVGASLALDLAGYSGGSIIFGIFLIVMLVFPFIAISRRPTYMLLRKILGNENLPEQPYPGPATKIQHQSLPWWAYSPGIWGWLMGLALLYAVIRYLLSK